MRRWFKERIDKRVERSLFVRLSALVWRDDHVIQFANALVDHDDQEEILCAAELANASGGFPGSFSYLESVLG